VAGGDTTVKVESASELNLRNALSELSVVLYRGDGGVEDSSDGVWSGSDEASLVVVPSDEGSGKWVLFQMGDDDYTHHSIWDLVIGPGGGGGGGGGGGDEVDVLRDMRSWFNRFLALIGLNSAGGRWLFILLLVLLETVFLYKRTLILTLVLCVTIGLAMSADWISPWIISVLGLILGFVIWTMLRRSRHAEG
jgi:general stress protein CsbA